MSAYRSPERDLGPLEATYGPKYRGLRALRWYAQTALFIAYAVYAIRAMAPGGYVIVGVAIVHLLIVWDMRRNSDIRVDVHRDGLRIHRAGAWRTIAWDDVVMYTTRVDRMGKSIWTMNLWSDVARTRVIVRTRDGEEIELSSALDGLLKVGARIRSESLARLRKAARRDLAAGKTLDFGRLSLDDEAIHREGKKVAWPEVASVRVEGGDIVVRRKGDRLAWSRDAYPGTPNAHLFVDLAERRLTPPADAASEPAAPSPS
jgi:hypothetical protein